MLTTTLTPNATLAYRVLDHIDAHPEQWDQSVYLGEGDCGTTACFAGWALLLSGVEMDRNWDVLADTLTPELAEGVHELLDRTRLEVDERWPMTLVDASEVAQVLLGVSEVESASLFYALNRRQVLGMKVERIFGPRPLSDGGPPMMTDAEITAELSIDRLALPFEWMHWADYQGDAVCSPLPGRATGDPLAVTCPNCLPLVDAGSARLLAAVNETRGNR